MEKIQRLIWGLSQIGSKQRDGCRVSGAPGVGCPCLGSRVCLRGSSESSLASPDSLVSHITVTQSSSHDVLVRAWKIRSPKIKGRGISRPCLARGRNLELLSPISVWAKGFTKLSAATAAVSPNGAILSFPFHFVPFLSPSFPIRRLIISFIASSRNSWPWMIRRMTSASRLQKGATRTTKSRKLQGKCERKSERTLTPITILFKYV